MSTEKRGVASQVQVSEKFVGGFGGGEKCKSGGVRRGGRTNYRKSRGNEKVANGRAVVLFDKSVPPEKARNIRSEQNMNFDRKSGGFSAGTRTSETFSREKKAGSGMGNAREANEKSLRMRSKDETFNELTGESTRPLTFIMEDQTDGKADCLCAPKVECSNFSRGEKPLSFDGYKKIEHDKKPNGECALVPSRNVSAMTKEHTEKTGGNVVFAKAPGGESKEGGNESRFSCELKAHCFNRPLQVRIRRRPRAKQPGKQTCADCPREGGTSSFKPDKDNQIGKTPCSWGKPADQSYCQWNGGSGAGDSPDVNMQQRFNENNNAEYGTDKGFPRQKTCGLKHGEGDDVGEDWSDMDARKRACPRALSPLIKANSQQQGGQAKHVGKQVHGLRDEKQGAKTVPREKEAYNNKANYVRKVCKEPRGFSTVKSNYKFPSPEKKERAAKGGWGRGVEKRVGEDIDDWTYASILRVKGARTSSERERESVIVSLASKCFKNPMWKNFLPDKEGGGRTKGFAELTVETTRSSNMRNGFTSSFKKNVSAFADRKEKKVFAGPKRNNARKEAVTVRENEWWTNWENSDQSDSGTAKNDHAADAPVRQPTNVSTTEPSTNEQVTELSARKTTMKPEIETYKGQDEFFTTGFAGVMLEPETFHVVYMGYWLSPLEFHVVFEHCKVMLEAMEKKLQAFYSDSSKGVPLELQISGMPCCVKNHDSVWQRAIIEGGGGERLIRFVDSGEHRCCNPDEIKALDKQFMELPPLAIQCKIIGADRDTFYQAILGAFRLDCKFGKRRQIKFFEGPKDSILYVELYNMAGRDLFMKHFGELYRKQEQAKRQREEAAKRRNIRVDKATGRIIRLPELTDDDYYSDDEDMYTGEKLRDVPNGYMVNGEIVRMNDLKLNDEDWPCLSNA